MGSTYAASVDLRWRQRFRRSVCGRTTTAEASAERRQHLSHVANEVVVDFGVVHHDQSSSVGLQRSSDVLRTESSEVVTVLDNDRCHGWISEQGEEFTSLAVETGANFGYDAVNRMALSRSPDTHTRYLGNEVNSLVGRRHASVDDGRAQLRRRSFELAHQN